MKEKKVYNEEVKDAAGVGTTAGDPSCGTESGVNVADGSEGETDTMSDAAAGADEKSGACDMAAEAAEWRDKHLRLQAEFDNYRKRTLREKMELVENGGKEVLKAMLPVCDDMQRALEAMEKSDDVEALRAGVKLIAQKLSETMRQRGVTPIEAKGAAFDADLHEAVAKFAAGEENRGRVVDVIQTGYMLGDKVLRFAKVVVGE